MAANDMAESDLAANDLAANGRQRGQARPVRIGLVCTLESRIASFASVLAEGLGFELVVLSAPRAHSETGLQMLLIDAGATLHLVALLRSFRRRRPQVPLLVLGRSMADESAERAIDAGASGYLSHSASASELAHAIEAVLSGSVWAPRRLLARLLDTAGHEGLAPLAEASLDGAGTLDEAGSAARRKPVSLTRRERQVLRLLMQGYVNREMARLLGIDPGTVKAHLARMMRRSGVNNRTALCVFALDHGWFS